uniref:Uncharacterized protein n=1 Tax=Coccidioides posadasii RMSCC 3488 TaxID=454284 RepID=A0A0J6F3U4_COCPO|nr:hypothetical protein CPAG_01165 [Coccidioides posadasii RMSCC 3488]
MTGGQRIKVISPAEAVVTRCREEAEGKPAGLIVWFKCGRQAGPPMTVRSDTLHDGRRINPGTQVPNLRNCETRIRASVAVCSRYHRGILRSNKATSAARNRSLWRVRRSSDRYNRVSLERGALTTSSGSGPELSGCSVVQLPYSSLGGFPGLRLFRSPEGPSEEHHFGQRSRRDASLTYKITRLGGLTNIDFSPFEHST